MRILVTGACGYKGTVLVPRLLECGHYVRAIDTMWFGNFLGSHPNLELIQGNVIEVERIDLSDIDVIIHLASIANDPCGDLDPKLTWETSALSTMQLADKAARSGVRQFIYASSGSVYGIKEEEKVTENLELKPVSEYNKSKMVAERALISYAGDMVVQIVRPATVCGYSPRMRLDVSVNMLTMQALSNGRITVLGGMQTRPNIHIDDIVDLYLYFLDNGETIQGIYNAGFENLTIMEIAEMVAAHVPTKIEVKPSVDPRSYRVNSDKLLATGFRPKKRVENAIEEIIVKFRTGELKNEEKFYNLAWMKKTLFP